MAAYYVRPEIGEAIERHRSARYLTLKQLGERIGVSQRTVGRWARGEREPFHVIDWIRLVDEIPDLARFVPPDIGVWVPERR